MPCLEMFHPTELLLLANECSLKVFIVVLKDHLADIWALDLRKLLRKATNWKVVVLYWVRKRLREGAGVGVERETQGRTEARGIC